MRKVWSFLGELLTVVRSFCLELLIVLRSIFLPLLIVGLIVGPVLGSLEFVVFYYHKPIFPPAIGFALCLLALLAVAAGAVVVYKRQFGTRWLPLGLDPLGLNLSTTCVVSGFVVFDILMFTDLPLPQFLISHLSLVGTVIILVNFGVLFLKRVIRR